MYPNNRLTTKVTGPQHSVLQARTLFLFHGCSAFAVRGGKPVRVDLWPIPVDLVLVSAPAQIQAMKADPGFARLHAVPTRAPGRAQAHGRGAAVCKPWLLPE